MDIDKQTEKQLRKALKNAPLEQPSAAFVHKVMQKIEASEDVLAYKPLISLKGWLAIAAALSIFVLVSFLYKNDTSFLDALNFEKWLAFSAKITISKNVGYSIVFIAVAVLLQIPVITSWHTKTMLKNSH
jgi:hypothetical protein